MEKEKKAYDPNVQEFNKVLHFIEKIRGVDLCSYRQNFSFRHLRSRLQDTNSATPLDYITYIKRHPEEIDLFLDALSINVTHFFRDSEVFEAFRNVAVTDLIGKKSGAEKGLIRIWSAGCASGQEPYSLAVLMKEALGNRDNIVVKIWATDVDADALEKARRGEYEERDFREINKKLLEKYFQPVYNGRYSVNDDVRRLVRFEKHNLITDEGLRFIDVVFCRNVMIYFGKQQQELLLNKFYHSLNTGGYLVLAKVESVWNKDLFVHVDPYNKIYQKAN